MKIYLLLNVTLGTVDKVIKEIKQIPNTSVNKTYGAYDIIVTIYGEDVESLREIVQWKIRKIEDVQSTLALIGTSTSERVSIAE